MLPMVKTPHGLLESALTTTIPRPAMETTSMKRMQIIDTMPANGPISVRAISARERPACRMEATRTMKS